MLLSNDRNTRSSWRRTWLRAKHATAVESVRTAEATDAGPARFVTMSPESTPSATTRLPSVPARHVGAKGTASPPTDTDGVLILKGS